MSSNLEAQLATLKLIVDAVLVRAAFGISLDYETFHCYKLTSGSFFTVISLISDIYLLLDPMTQHRLTLPQNMDS